MKLYCIASELSAVLAAVDDSGELPPDAEARLDGLTMALEDKADNICRLIQQRKAEARAYDVESGRLWDLKVAAEKDAERLSRYLLRTLESLSLKRLDTPLFKLTACQNSQPSVELAEGQDVPAAFSRVKVELDRQAVVAAWKKGLTLPEGVSVEVKSHLRIK